MPDFFIAPKSKIAYDCCMRGLFKIFLFTFFLISSGYQAYSASDVCGSEPCGKGQYCRSSVMGCGNCPEGYTDGTNASKETECYKECPKGGRITGGERILKNSDGRAYAKNGECEYTVKCDAGYYVNATGDACSPCPTGSYQTSGNFSGTSCTLCATGYTNSGTGNIAACATECRKSQADSYASTSWKTNPTEVNYCVINRCKSGFRVNGDDSNNTCTGYKYKIKFNVNGGTDQPDKDCTYGEYCYWTNTTKKTGAIFLGWGVNSSTTSPLISGGTYLPAMFNYDPYTSLTIPTSDNATVNLYAKWQDCSNEGSSYALEWGSNCTILSCKPQYYLSATDDGKGACKLCDSSGYYCPGGKDICTNGKCICEKGYYCPGNITSKPSDCDNVGDSIYTGRCKCPMGSTNSGTGISASSSCYRASGSNGTKYCDKHGCFFLKKNIYNR